MLFGLFGQNLHLGGQQVQQANNIQMAISGGFPTLIAYIQRMPTIRREI
jgi:hypothetical protein